MRSVRIAAVILFILCISVTLNSVMIKKSADSLAEQIDSCDPRSPSAEKDFKKIFREFEKKEKFISLTVSHDDLTNIEEGFAELIGAAEAGNISEMEKQKSRLTDALGHLGRLSGFNIDSIF